MPWSRYYSKRTRILLKNGNMEGYRGPDTQRVHWVSGPVFFLNRTFSAAWNIRCPDTSLKRRVSRPVNVLTFLDTPSIKKFYRNPSAKRVCFSLSINFHATDGVILIYLQNVNEMWRFHAVKCHEIPWYVKIPVFSLDWNSTVHEIPAFWQHWNSTVHEISNA